MNNLKFRAWDKENKRWIDEYMFVIDSGGQFQMQVSAREFYPEVDDLLNKGDIGDYRVVDYTDWTFESIDLVQSTGLKDKKGNEVYEGDILKWTARDNDNSIMSQIDVVKRDRYGFFTVGGDCLCDPANRSQVRTQSVILGNIYENPTLLK